MLRVPLRTSNDCFLRRGSDRKKRSASLVSASACLSSLAKTSRSSFKMSWSKKIPIFRPWSFRSDLVSREPTLRSLRDAFEEAGPEGFARIMLGRVASLPSNSASNLILNFLRDLVLDQEPRRRHPPRINFRTGLASPRRCRAKIDRIVRSSSTSKVTSRSAAGWDSRSQTCCRS